MSEAQFLDLIERIRNGQASDEDIRLYHTWFQSFQRSGTEWNTLEMGEAEELRSALKERINTRIGQSAVKPVRRLWPRIAAAASILLMLTAGTYFFLHRSDPAPNTAAQILAGHNQATLTLANGQKIVLVKGMSGKLAQQGQTSIQIGSGSKLSYFVSNQKNRAGTVLYNTLSTAKGEQSPYPLILTDGTKVWLNAESSITFPTAFTGTERTVKMTGEAYFEVAHHSHQPFKIHAGDQLIEDIGTQFNVNSYSDEPDHQTTLIEGSVRISAAASKAQVILKPGQRSVLTQNTTSLRVSSANINEAIAWKNGYFRFSGIGLHPLMRQISRWYDVEVIYQGAPDSETFTGVINRQDNLAKMLRILESGDVHYKIEGRKLILIP